MWDLPGPGFEPMSPALAGKFFTTEPLGKRLPPRLLIEITYLISGLTEVQVLFVVVTGEIVYFSSLLSSIPLCGY